MEFAREQAIDAVAEPRHDQHRERPAVMFVRNQNQENWKEAQAQQRDLIGNRPDAAFHLRLRITQFRRTARDSRSGGGRFCARKVRPWREWSRWARPA